MPKIAKEYAESEIIEKLSEIYAEKGAEASARFAIGGKSCAGLYVFVRGQSVTYMLAVTVYTSGKPKRKNFGLGSFYKIPLDEVKQRVQRALRMIETGKFDLRMIKHDLLKPYIAHIKPKE